MKRARITEEQRQYILDHINDRPRVNVARACGVHIRTVYRLAKIHGGEMRPELSTPNLRYRDITAKYYPTMSASEIEQAYGVPKSKVTSWAAKLGIGHTPATRLRLAKKRLPAQRDAESYERQRIRWQRKRKTDELRILSGLPQLTRFRFSRYPKATAKAIWYLERRYNYFRDEEAGGIYTLFYDEHTRRTPREQHYVKKYKLKFQEA